MFGFIYLAYNNILLIYHLGKTPHRSSPAVNNKAEKHKVP